MTNIINDISNKRKERRKHNSNLEISGTQEFFTPKFLCGCPKDKAKEYAEYVKNYVEKQDKEIKNAKI